MIPQSPAGGISSWWLLNVAVEPPIKREVPELYAWTLLRDYRSRGQRDSGMDDFLVQPPEERIQVFKSSPDWLVYVRQHFPPELYQRIFQEGNLVTGDMVARIIAYFRSTPSIPRPLSERPWLMLAGPGSASRM